MKRIIAILLLAVCVAFAVEEIKPYLWDVYWWPGTYGGTKDTFVAPGDSIYTLFIPSLQTMSTQTLAWAVYGGATPGGLDSFRFDLQFCFAYTRYPNGTVVVDSTYLPLWVTFYQVTAANDDTIGFYPLAELTYLGTNIGWIPSSVPGYTRGKLVNLDDDTIYVKWVKFCGAGSP